MLWRWPDTHHLVSSPPMNHFRNLSRVSPYPMHVSQHSIQRASPSAIASASTVGRNRPVGPLLWKFVFQSRCCGLPVVLYTWTHQHVPYIQCTAPVHRHTDVWPRLMHMCMVFGYVWDVPATDAFCIIFMQCSVAWTWLFFLNHNLACRLTVPWTLYTCVCAYIHTYMHTQGACIHWVRAAASCSSSIHTQIHTYMHRYTHRHMHACMHAYIHRGARKHWVGVFASAFIAYSHIYMHTYIQGARIHWVGAFASCSFGLDGPLVRKRVYSGH
jgi:hypothetical protein